ncbi:hypothetical protein JHK87_052047 [Glycine soja]|nr:hypothetical protein JHK87_052047 [Glycine soja]
MPLKKGYKHIVVQGDSLLVCNQEYNSEADAQANLAINLRGQCLISWDWDLGTLHATDKRTVGNSKMKRVVKAVEEETQQELTAVDESEQPSTSEAPPVVVPVSPSDTLTMFFQAEGTVSETAIPALTKALEETDGVTDLKFQLAEGLAILELKKQTTVQATGVASGLLETIQGSGFKLQTLNLSFEDEEVAVA